MWDIGAASVESALFLPNIGLNIEAMKVVGVGSAVDSFSTVSRMKLRVIVEPTGFRTEEVPTATNGDKL